MPELEDLDVDDLWFQQDGATCHTANETIILFTETFRGRIISCCGHVALPLGRSRKILRILILISANVIYYISAVKQPLMKPTIYVKVLKKIQEPPFVHKSPIFDLKFVNV